MAFGDTETLSPEEAASLGASKPAAQTLKVVGSESLPQVVGEPVDVFSDVELFKQWKASRPAQDKWETVKAVTAELGSQIWEFAKEIPSLAGKTARGMVNPTKLPGALKDNAAFVAETGAEAYKGFATMGKFMLSAGQKGLAASAEAFGADKKAQQLHEEEALKAEMDFYRTARDFTSTVNDGRVMLDNVKNTVVGAVNAEWAGENTFTDTAVNEKAALFAANLVDPDVGAVLTKAAMRGYAGKIVGKLVNLAPPEGMIRAAERDVVAAIAAKSDAQETLLAAKAAGADTGKLTTDLSKAEQDLIEANQYLRTRLAELDQQAAVGKGTAQRVAGKGIELAGRGVEKFGQVVGGINRRIGEFVDNFGSGGGEAAVRGAIDTVPGVGWINRLDNAFESAGSQIKVAGQYISAAESSLGYFQSLARALPEDTVGRWAASRMERFENLATTGRWIMDSVDTTAKTTAIGAGFGALSGDPTAGATQGFWFGMAGSQFGQFARMNSPEEVRARQQVDVAIARRRRANAPGEQAKLFDEAGAGLQLATATFEQAYPDLNIKFVRGGGKQAAGWYENRGLFGEITIDLDHPTPVAGLLTHEVKHHLGRNPEIKQAVEAKILGDPNTGEIGIFTALDEQGRPILEETPSAENAEVTQKRFKLAPEFEKYREEYLQRLRDANEPTIEYERDPRLIAHEIWAESEAANLLGRQVNGKFDIIAQSQMGGVQRLVADTVAGSDLVKSTAFLQKALAKFGVVFDGEGKAANTGLFSTSFELKGLNKAVEKYNRLRSDERALNEDPDFRDARLYTEAEILASPQLMEMYSGGHDVVRDPVTGKMRFIPEGEAKRRAKDFTETLQKELAAYTGNEPGVVREQTVVDANGRESKVWRGTHIPETVIKKLEESGRFNEVQLKTIRDLNQVMRLGAGNEANFMYQPASKRGGKQYRTRPITERTETPMAFQISKDGNLLVTTISQEKLIRNAVDAIKAGKATLWGNDFKALWTDVGQYLRNHQNGESGAANGLGVEKRDFINSLFGQLTNAQREANPLIQEVSDRRARNAGIVQSRRLDRTNRLTVLSTKFKPDYASVAKNFSPAKKGAALEGSLGDGEIKFTHFSDTPGLKDLDPKMFGKSGTVGASERAGLNRSYAYAEGSKLGQDKGLIDIRGNRYEGSVPKGKIYDSTKDPLGYWDMINREKADQMLVDRGFIGIYKEGRGGVKQLEFFDKVPMKPGTMGSGKQLTPGAKGGNESGSVKITETPEFKSWFDGSKVVDTQGQPLRVYHGTNLYQYGDKVLGDITTFERDKSKIKGGKPEFDAVGSWFSASPDAAAIYGKAIYPTYLNLKNPLTMTWAEFMQRGQKGDPKWTSKNLAKKGEMPRYMAEGAWNPEGLRSWLKEQGYDGIKFPASEKVDGQPHDVFVALEPTQIKSAIGNAGTFDPTNPDIRRSPGAKVSVAPLRSTSVPDFNSLGTLDAPLKQLEGTVERVGKNLGIKLDAKRVVGGWQDTETGNVVREGSLAITVNDDLPSEKLKALAAYLGKNAPELQNAVMVFEPGDGPDTLHSLTIKDAAAAEALVAKLNDYGLGAGFSFDPAGNTLHLVSSDAASVAKLVDDAKAQGILTGYESQSGTAAFPGSGDYDALIQPFAKEIAGGDLPAPNAPTVSTVAIRKGLEKPDLGPKPGVLEIGRYLAARSRKAKRIPYDSRTEGAKDAAATALADEIAYAVEQDRNAIGWYERKINEAMDILAEIHPELKDDENVSAFYKAVLAITSNGQDVVSNFQRAEELYRTWKETGRLEVTSQWGGARANQINDGLTKLQALVDLHGLEDTRKFLMREFRFGDIKRLAKEMLGIDLAAAEPVDHVVRGSIVFGPKVGGGFFPNLNGDFSPVTMDLWLMRTWNRINGSYGQSDTVSMGRAIDRLRKAAVENPSHPDAAKVSTMSDRQLGNWAVARYADWSGRRKFKDADAFDRPAKAFAEAKEGAVESPRNGSERAWVREIFKAIDAKIAERGLPPINNADKQALLWYYEKDLYTALGYTNNRGQPADYADAARKVYEARKP